MFSVSVNSKTWNKNLLKKYGYNIKKSVYFDNYFSWQVSKQMCLCQGSMKNTKTWLKTKLKLKSK